MNEVLDKGIQDLFDAARNDAPDAAFVATVMAKVNAQRRHTLVVWTLAGVVLLAVAAMLTGPVTILNWSFVRDDVPRSLACRQIALAIREDALITQFLAPLNSVAAIVGVSLLVLLYAVRKLFGRC